LAVALAGALVAGAGGVVVRSRVGDGRAGGAAVPQAVAYAAQITVRTANSLFHIGTIVLPPRGHGDAWFRQGRQTDRREPRNAVPPRKSERQADNCQHFLRSRCLVSETSSRSPLRGSGRAI